MSTQLYLTPLPAADASRADKAVASAIEQAGLLQEGGTSTENVATDSVDLVVDGQVRWGRTLSKKIGEEVDSLSESTYVALPLFNTTNADERIRGYYEVETADVSPAKPGVEHAVEYAVGLKLKATRESAYLATATAVQSVDGLHGTGDPLRVAVPAAATEVHWFDRANGLTDATPTATVSAEFGDVELYDPDAAPESDPTLVYDLPFADDGPTDVRVYDDRGGEKFAESVSGDDVNQWIHAYHDGYQFDGSPVIDSGRVRLWLGPLRPGLESLTVADGETYTVTDGTSESHTTLTVETGGVFTVESGGSHTLTGGTRDDLNAQRYNPATEAWEAVALDDDGIGYALTAWDIERVGGTHVRAQLTFSDGSTTARVNAEIDRGSDSVLFWTPENAGSTPADVTELLGPLGAARQETAAAERSTVPKSNTRE